MYNVIVDLYRLFLLPQVFQKEQEKKGNNTKQIEIIRLSITKKYHTIRYQSQNQSKFFRSFLPGNLLFWKIT